MRDTILVTGGAGFIGSNFVRCALARTGAQLVVVDKLTYAGNLLNLDGLLDDPRVTFERADIGDSKRMDGVLRQHAPAAVVNLAAETHVDRSIDNPRPFIDTNLVGTFELLRAVHAYWADQPEPARERFRFLHVSTDEVCGSLGPTGAFSEETPYAPNSPYAASKAGADHLVRAYQCAVLEAERPASANPVFAGRAAARYAALKQLVKDRPGHDRRYAIDASTIRRAPGRGLDDDPRLVSRSGASEDAEEHGAEAGFLTPR